jgi:hypothetical protein
MATWAENALRQRRRVARAVARLDPDRERDARWTEAVSEFDAS